MYSKTSDEFTSKPGREPNFERSRQYTPPHSPEKYQGDISLTEDDNQINTILKNMKEKLFDIEAIIRQKEGEKNAILEDITILSERLKILNKNISKKKITFENFEKTLRDAETAYGKITESAKTLLLVVKKENANFNKTIGLK